MKKYALIGAAILGVSSFGIATASAEDIGVHVGPIGAGVTVGEGHYDRDHDRRDRDVVVREREPRDRTTIIKKSEDGVESKTVIHHDNY